MVLSNYHCWFLQKGFSKQVGKSSKWWCIKLVPLCDRAEEYGPLFRIFVLHKCMVVPTSRGSMKVNVTYMSHSDVGKCYTQASTYRCILFHVYRDLIQ